MAFYGDLRTVSLADLMRWASSNEKTGVLEIERNAISRRVEFRKGWVGSCSSNDPASLLGQFLLARGKINETQLQHMLALKKVTSKRLGLLLVEMKVLSRAELTSEVAAKAEETIYSLFDWPDAFFRYDDGATLDPDMIEVNLAVEDLIAEGEKRAVQLETIRVAFPSSGVVLSRIEAGPPGDIADRPLTRKMFESIDGQRTIAELLLHNRGSDFLVLQFLHRLFERGLLEICEERTVQDDAATLLDTIPSAPPTEPGWDPEITTAEIDRDASAPPSIASDPSESSDRVDPRIGAAIGHLERREYESAIDLLRASCRAHATDYALRLLSQAENDLLEEIKGDDAFTSSVPVLLQDRHELQHQDAAPAESFLISLIDGTIDVQSILWLAPMREIEVLLALRRMEQRGILQLARRSVGCG